MLKENRTIDKYDEYIKQVIEDLEAKGYEDIRADMEGYELPAKLSRQDSEEYYVPDITAKKYGRKHYFEISRKTSEVRSVTGKWRLLSTLSEMRNSSFKLLVPRGSMKFTNEILAKHPINAEVVKLS